MTLDEMRARKAQLVESLKESTINCERLRGAIWFCDEVISKLEGNGLDVHDAQAE